MSSVPPPDGTGAEYSKEYVQKLMEENAGLRKRTSVQDQRDRDVIKAAQPSMAEYIKTLTDHYPDHQREISQIGSWAGAVQPHRPIPLLQCLHSQPCASTDKSASLRVISATATLPVPSCTRPAPGRSTTGVSSIKTVRQCGSSLTVTSAGPWLTQHVLMLLLMVIIFTFDHRIITSIRVLQLPWPVPPSQVLQLVVL